MTAGWSHGHLRIGQQRANALALDVRRRGQAAEVHQRRVDAHEIHRAVAAAVGLRHAGHDPDVRRAGALLPERELAPVVLLAQVPAVVAPETDDRVVALGRLVVGVEQAAHHRVAEVDGGQVGADGLLPGVGAALLEDRLVIAAARGHLQRDGRQIVEVVLLVRRQLNALQRELVVVLLRHAPRQVRLGQAAGDEERLVVLLVQLRDGVVHELVVRHVLVAAIERRDGQLAGAAPSACGEPSSSRARPCPRRSAASHPTPPGDTRCRGKSCPRRRRSNRPCETAW